MALLTLRPLAARSATDFDDRLLGALAGPLRLGALLLFFSLGVFALGLSVPAQRFFVGLEKVAVVFVATWLVVRLVDVAAGFLEARLLERDQAAAITLLPLGRKSIKAVVIGLAGLAALDTFGFDVTALIAGLGVGGLAVALAGQKTVENLFGGITVVADRPVRVGDFCRFGDRVGVVEQIGLRSTRVRTLDRTLVTVPNAEFSSLQLENFAVRDKMWYHPTIGLRYETTPDQLRYVLVEVRRMLYSHPRVDPDPARIRFKGFGAYSLDLEIFAYVLTPDFNDYLEVSEDLNLRIMDIVAASGTGFAFPSSTTYLAKDEGLDAERVERAEAAVREWRQKRQLYLPAFPEEEKKRLSGRLGYPPEGSPERKDPA